MRKASGKKPGRQLAEDKNFLTSNSAQRHNVHRSLLNWYNDFVGAYHIKTSPRAIESAARARLNMVRANEIVVPIE